jgi:hypothetical protein
VTIFDRDNIAHGTLTATATGVPLAISQGLVTGMSLTGAYPILDAPTLGDGAITVTLTAPLPQD